MCTLIESNDGFLGKYKTIWNDGNTYTAIHKISRIEDRKELK